MVLSTGMMLHPIISLPLVTLIKPIITGIEKVIGLCRIDARHKLKFTLTMYFAMILSFQIFLTQSWESKRLSENEKHGDDR